MGNDSKGPVTVRIPVRIDFAGGWSDVHYFSEREGGAVLNAAISPYVVGRARWEGWQLHLEYSLALPYNAARRRKAVRARLCVATPGQEGRGCAEEEGGSKSGCQPTLRAQPGPRVQPSQPALVPPTRPHGCRRVQV
jgi:hypothetical protein